MGNKIVIGADLRHMYEHITASFGAKRQAANASAATET